jgi:ABC-type transport system involved in cytochrome c biogenesis permease subunit
MEILLYITLVLYVLTFSSFVLSILTPFNKDLFKDRLRRAGLLLVSLGLLTHLGAIAIRAYYSGRLPAVGVFETLSLFAWVMTIFTLIVAIRYKEILIASVTLVISALALVFALNGLAPPSKLPPILQTYWFEIHVVASFTAYALFTLAFTAGLLFTICKAASIGGDRGDGQGGERRLTDLHDITLRAILWGFFFFSLSMFSGAIWGYLAWGAYWQWEPKTLWSFIVWFWYAGVIHLIYLKAGTKKWREYSVPVASLIGFLLVLATWLGVGLLMKSSHSF